MVGSLLPTFFFSCMIANQLLWLSPHLLTPAHKLWLKGNQFLILVCLWSWGWWQLDPPAMYHRPKRDWLVHLCSDLSAQLFLIPLETNESRYQQKPQPGWPRGSWRPSSWVQLLWCTEWKYWHCLILDQCEFYAGLSYLKPMDWTCLSEFFESL